MSKSKKVTQKLKESKKHLIDTFDDLISEAEQFGIIESDLDNILNQENDKEITDFLPEHLNNIRYASAIEAIFENIEKIPIEVLEALAQNNYNQLSTTNS